MKKVLALTLALVMMLAFAACGGSDDSKGDISNGDSAKEAANPAVQAYLESAGENFTEELEAGFETSSGMECDSTVEVVGNGIVVNLNVHGLNDVPEDTKEQLQQTYDSMSETFEGILEMLQAECPECDSLTYNVCEEDGDILAVIDIK